MDNRDNGKTAARTDGAGAHLPPTPHSPPTTRPLRTLTDVQDFVREARAAAVLTIEDERILGWRIINDQCAQSRDELARANLRLVVATAEKHSGRGVPLAELLRKGNIGLLRAIDSFDPAQGTRFSTHASWWIKEAIRRVPPSTTIQPSAVPSTASPQAQAGSTPTLQVV